MSKYIMANYLTYDPKDADTALSLTISYLILFMFACLKMNVKNDE